MRKRNHADYVQALAALGKVEVLEPYQNGRTPIKHRCLQCGNVQMIRPEHALRGSGCRLCGAKAPAAQRNQRAAKNYANRLAAIGKLEVLEPYINAKTPILHKCLEHGLIQKCKPNNALSGKGLNCCKQVGVKKFLDERTAKCRSEYESKLAAIGKVEALEPYIGSSIPILHRCLKHGTEQMVRPDQMLSGRGLKCCQGTIGMLKYEGSKYEKECAQHGRVLPLEPYQGIRVRILHKCLTHGETHLASPHTILKGHGLKCCNLGGDSLARFRKDSAWANRPCHVYVARIDGGYLKPGIAEDTTQRAEQGDGFYSGYAFISDQLTRAEAWAIEQRLLSDSVDAKPDTLPEIFKGWEGYTELREKDVLHESWYVNRFWELLAEVGEEGWEAVVPTGLT